MAAGSRRTRADGEQARAQRLEDLHRQLADGVAALRDSDAWRSWLDSAARFHSYSFNNQVLIAAQRPDATLVAGYQAWAAMGRQVRRGEKALWVLAPVTDRPAKTAEDDQQDSAARPRVVGLRPVSLFDVSQTTGKPLPQQPRPELLAGQAPPGLWGSLERLIGSRGFQVRRCPDAAALGGANGTTSYRDRTVTVRADVDDAQAAKTLAHEAGHVLLHDPRTAGDGPACRDLVEVEAESVAYLVAAHHGLDTAGYTFPYIAGWAGRDERAVTDTGRRVLDAARTVLRATDPSEPDPRTAGLAADATAAVHAAEAAADHARTTRDHIAAALNGPDPARLRAATAAAQQWFLEQSAGNAAYRDAVHARGYSTDETVELGIGYAPPTWTGLVDHLHADGYTAREILDAGLAVTSSRGRPIDRFRGRVTFPIHDAAGVVGFTARDCTGDPEVPKYINSPNGALFSKSALLYGTQHIPPRRPGDPAPTLVLAEGPWDAIAVTASGHPDHIGVAACGTSVTGQHLDLIRRHGGDLILAPDADAPGNAALRRTLAMIAGRGEPHPRAVACTVGGDLADLYNLGGMELILEVLDDARPAGIVHAETHLSNGPRLRSAEARVAAARTAAAASAGLGPGDLAELRRVLQQHTRIGDETARAITGEPPPRPAPPHPLLARAMAGVRVELPGRGRRAR